jgi:hypothetical protein
MRISLLALSLAFSLLAETAAGVRWTPPPGWKNEGARPMRIATYVLPTGPNDKAECAVYFFGPGQGGTVDANIDRWKGQLLDAAGKPAKAQVDKKSIHGGRWRRTRRTSSKCLVRSRKRNSDTAVRRLSLHRAQASKEQSRSLALQRVAASRGGRWRQSATPPPRPAYNHDD